ncbi:MAG: hypothetical protein JNL32_06475 [Candidatus Kapabacteria bacterium]|nr:hypothetical protein [Candidatus Kapabacteria bacterium]
MNREILLGKKALAERELRDLENIADSALTMIIMKADAYKDFDALDTELISTNAQTLHDTVVKLRECKKVIAKLKSELGE